MKRRSRLKAALAASVRSIAGQAIWTRPEIAATFRPQPPYFEMFKGAWLAFMWGNPERRGLREAVAVAISAANQCCY